MKASALVIPVDASKCGTLMFWNVSGVHTHRHACACAAASAADNDAGGNAHSAGASGHRRYPYRHSTLEKDSVPCANWYALVRQSLSNALLAAPVDDGGVRRCSVGFQLPPTSSWMCPWALELSCCAKVFQSFDCNAWWYS